MQITTRPYGGKLFRPLPEVHISEDQNLVIVATPWGQTAIAKDFINGVTTIWRDSARDIDRAKGYAHDDGLSPLEHLFKMAVLAVHEDLKDKYNEEELSAGLEVLCILRTQHKIAWFQVGAPALVLVRDQALTPLFHPVDFSHDFSTPELLLPPLPKDLLGVQQQVNLTVGGLKLHKGDRFLMVSRSSIPSRFFQTLDPQSLTLDAATEIFAQDNENQPFWMGLLLMD